ATYVPPSPGPQIDDAQPPSPECDLGIDVEPLVVWPSVAERVCHPLERAASLFGLSVHEETGDPAHRRLPAHRAESFSLRAQRWSEQASRRAAQRTLSQPETTIAFLYTARP